eukprot:2342635-Prymnesium_polylepis.1
MLRVGGFSEHIADRPLPKGLGEWKLLSEEELKEAGRKNQFDIAPFAVAETQADTQPDAQSAIAGVSEAAAQGA